MVNGFLLGLAGAPGEASASGQAASLVPLLYVLLLATFIGLGVITRVSRLLHTPLMSLTNAISAIAVVAAISIAAEHRSGLSTFLGTVAVVAATSNIVGGFLITDRMLRMFKSRKPEDHR